MFEKLLPIVNNRTVFLAVVGVFGAGATFCGATGAAGCAQDTASCVPTHVKTHATNMRRRSMIRLPDVS
ncbi:MAG: hypothetical protein QM811_25475 [Pirellulales bacterium]